MGSRLTIEMSHAQTTTEPKARDATCALAQRLVSLTNDPDTGPIDRGHVCKHGIRWPHECQPCADDAWERHILETSQANDQAEARRTEKL